MDKILLDHGSGGKISHSLISDIILPAFNNTILSRLGDGALLDLGESRIAFSTDTFTVDPLFFPGGDIGRLAINGTVNDIAMCGATPLFMSVGFLIEEGFPMEDMENILASMRSSAQEAEVQIVTGDTKVVPRGAADRFFVNTTGVGLVPEGIEISPHKATPGDRIILSGSIGDHGITVLLQREAMTLDAPIRSDTAPLNHLVNKMINISPDIHVLRDPTRGGLGTALNEIARSSGVGIRIRQNSIPVRPEVESVCELMGFDPLYIANEGKLIAIIPENEADNILSAMRRDRYAREAVIIGEVVSENPGMVLMETKIGGVRIVDMLTGEQLPRIC
ncbi:MAG: hydrogenase expression/formation protein HypE [Thermodesulfobacteriota bacterium]|nr:hydrogenase expression/formation protein HypE [Thermodesulfobacteriota bacterium]